MLIGICGGMFYYPQNLIMSPHSLLQNIDPLKLTYQTSKMRRKENGGTVPGRTPWLQETALGKTEARTVP
jgi:hypothetical protein